MNIEIKNPESKAIISTSMNVEEIEKIKNCQTLEHKIIVHDKIDNWYSFEEICNKSNMYFDRDIVTPTKSSDPMLMYFTSGSTGMPKMVERDNAYAFSHYITQKFWQDLKSMINRYWLGKSNGVYSIHPF